MAWGEAVPTLSNKIEDRTTYGREYYTGLLNNAQPNQFPVRIAAVGKENTAKTGLLIDLALKTTTGTIVVLDVDNSASQTVLVNYPNNDRIKVIPIYDAADISMFHEDNSTNWVALVEKMSWFMRILGEECRTGEVGAVILDGASTFLKWCEFSMTDVLVRRGVIKEEGDSFNQKEWRTRNKLFRDVINRAHQLQVPFVGYTFHLKDVKEFMDIGGGSKGLMKVGEAPEWENGTKRLFSQQIWLTRYSKKGDMAAGVKKDDSLSDNEWVIRATVSEMKGMHQEYLGTTHDVLAIKNGEVKWNGLPFLNWKTQKSQKGATGNGET
tara:strand:+ start:2242 stop:3213 length:972 start_codon:yes stop_codon:yes gene_type:complete